MKYTYKDLPGSVKRLEVEFSQVEFSKYWETVHSEAVKEVEIKGFRKGTAPVEMASAALDKDKVFSEAATRAIRETLKEITNEKGWEIVDQPKINIEEKADGFIFKIDLVVFPEIKLGNYKKLAKNVFFEKTEVVGTDEEVKEAIDWILNSRAKLVRSVNPAKTGDVVDIVYKGKQDQFVLGSSHIEADGCEHCAAEDKGSKEHKHDKSDWIDKKIVGHKECEEFDGIKLVSIFVRELPEMTDALAAELGKFKTVDEMKTSIKDGIQKEKEIKENEKKRIILLEKIVKDSKLDIPQVMIEKTLAGMIEEYKAYFSAKGAAPAKFGGQGSVSDGKNEDELKEKLRPEAEKNVASNLVLYRISKDEKLEPSSDEIEAESNKFLAAMRPDMVAKIDPERVHNYSYDIVKNKKVFDFLEKIK
ncbi:MAG: trigger factor [Patescibacteria group bacterium]